MIETIHLFALTLLFGSILVLNLRLFGLVMQQQPISQLARTISPYLWGSLGMMVASGVLLFFSEALKLYSNTPFRTKMVLLFTALIFHFTIYRKVTAADEIQVKSIWMKFAAVVSLTLWLGVGFAGGAIAYF